ncbi:uncharacterized protein LOC144134268 [Amblyomma americanum]
MVVIRSTVQVVPSELCISCTRSGQRSVCQLLGRLEAFNAVLCHLGLQLREDEVNLGDVRLVALESFPHEHHLQMLHSARVAIHLLHSLFTHHRCLVCVELTCNVARCELLAEALTRSHGVKKLLVLCCEAVVSREEECIHERVLQLIKTMTQIEELLFLKWRMRYDYLFVRTFPVGCAAARLVTIDVAHLELYEKAAMEFIAQLSRSNTVTSLSVSKGVFRLDCFADYLKNNPTIKSLALRSLCVSETDILRNLVSAISTMTMLEELTVVIWYLGAEDIDIFAQVVARNRTLRELSLTWPMEPLEDRLALCARLVRGSPQKTKSWLPALKNNSVLETLTVDFLELQEADCHAFFRALMHNTTLTRVTVFNLPTACDLKKICGTIRECGLSQRVVIKNHYVDYITLGDIPVCPEVTAVSLDTLHMDCDPCATLEILGSCGHIRSAFFMIDSGYMNEVHSYLSAFIAGAANLKELWLRLMGYSHNEANSILSKAQSSVVEAVSLNANLNAVTLIDFDFSNADCALLAEFAVRGAYLHHVKVDCENNTNLGFLQHLAPVVTGSYNLIRVHVPYCDEAKEEHFTVQEVTRRNSSLLIRAIRFVLGDMTSHCARALEFVSDHPKFAEMVADRAAVKCDEAKAMIRRALYTITDMNGFLRAACVVKHRVECCARRDGQMQLDELNDDCWLHVRKYIMVADVQEPSLLHH